MNKWVYPAQVVSEYNMKDLTTVINPTHNIKDLTIVINPTHTIQSKK